MPPSPAAGSADREDELLSIGRFAAACRLTVTTLRHYDDVGLLPPAHVDPVTSYRSYRRSQVTAAITIGALRALGLGLSTIRTIIDDPGSAEATLAAEHERAVRELHERERAVATIGHLSAFGGVPTPEVRLERRDPVVVHGLTFVAPAEGVVQRTTDALALIVATVEAAGRRWSDPVASIMESSIDDDEVQLTVVVAADDGPAPVDGLELGQLAGGTFATATHVGPYELAGFAHHAVRAWADAAELAASGPVQELYVNDPAETPPSSLVTVVALPVDVGDRSEDR